MTDQDRDILVGAMTCWQEARGEGIDGIRAVAHAIVNRHKEVDATGRPRWYARKTVAGTCLLPNAFSGWMTKDPNHEASAEVPMNDPIMASCVTEMAMAISGGSQDPTGRATHYYASGTDVPSWSDPATGSIFCTQIGRHRFYKGVA